MRHLHHTLLNDDVFSQVSPLFQLAGSPREYVRPQTLLDGLNAGWAVGAGINEQDPTYRRSLLLTYLGTFPAHNLDRRSDSPVTSAMLDAQALADRTRVNWGAPMAVVHRLLDLGADPFLPDHDGRDALDQVMALQWTSVLDRLLRLNDPRVAPEALAQRTQFTRWLEFSQGAGKHPGITPAGADGLELPWLHAAAAKGRLAVMECLLDHGMDVNQRDAWGRTPLFYVPFDAVVQRLLERGADPTVRDAFGERANAAWTRFSLGSDELKAMNARFLTAYRAAPGADTNALKDEQRAALFHQAVTGTASTFQAFMKSHGFSADEVMAQDGRDLSLLAQVAIRGLNDTNRSPAIASFLVTQVKDRQHASLHGMPDVVLAWLFAHSGWQSNTEKARRNADHAMARAFAWDLSGGFERCLDEVLFPLFERLLGPPTLTPDATVADPDLVWLQQRMRLDTVRQGVVKALERTLDGSMEARHAQAALRSVGPNGTSRAWHWAAIAARHHGDMAGMNAVHNVVMAMVGGTEQVLFQIPPDEDTAQALIGVLGQHSGLLPSHRSPQCEWGVGSLISALHQVLVERQTPLNTAQSGFPALIAALQKTQPLIAQAIERRTLEETLATGPLVVGGPKDCGATRRERSRL